MIKEKQLADLLLRLGKQFDLRLFTLNYDDLVDRVALPWRDGFISNSSNFYQSFEPKQFLEDDKMVASLLVHMHASVLIGYAQEGIYEIHKYKSPEIAMRFLDDKGFSQNDYGRIILCGPLISGLTKVEQLMFRPSPYG